jgi:hypothetical protein
MWYVALHLLDGLVQNNCWIITWSDGKKFRHTLKKSRFMLCKHVFEQIIYSMVTECQMHELSMDWTLYNRNVRVTTSWS